MLIIFSCSPQALRCSRSARTFSCAAPYRWPTGWALPPLLIGLTVVGFGTSMPELLVSPAGSP